MNWNHTKYQLLNTLREPSFMFWTVVYPLFMALIFFTAFQGVLDPAPMRIKVGVEQGSAAAQAFAGIDVLAVQTVKGDEAASLIKNGEITGYVDGSLQVTVGRSGIEETVLATIVSEMKQMRALGAPLENYDFQTSYVQTRAARANPLLIPFYSLIGMVSLYSIYMGVEFGRIMQADQSMEALRLNVVPLKKSDFVLGSLLIGLVLNLIANVLLLLFFHFVLRMDLITDPLPSLAVILAANLFGIMLGLVIGSFSKISLGAKNGIVIGSTLLMAFAAGMMSPDILILVEDRMPWLNDFNPVAIVTTQLYRLNYLDQSSTLGRSILLLLAMAAVLMAAGLLLLRRKSYDSL